MQIFERPDGIIRFEHSDLIPGLKHGMRSNKIKFWYKTNEEDWKIVENSKENRDNIIHWAFQSKSVSEFLEGKDIIWKEEEI